MYWKTSVMKNTHFADLTCVCALKVYTRALTRDLWLRI